MRAVERTERPILFSGAMVRAILAGRKTQTRRVARLTAAGRVKKPGSTLNWHPEDADAWRACPHGVPGHRLWVRETWAENESGGTPRYAADLLEPKGHGIWRPAIFMPRGASRITLQITSVRLERLQEITEADARAEGVGFDFREGWDIINGKRAPWSTNPFVWVIGFEKVSQRSAR